MSLPLLTMSLSTVQMYVFVQKSNRMMIKIRQNMGRNKRVSGDFSEYLSH